MGPANPLKSQNADRRTSDRSTLRLRAAGRIERSDLELEMYNISRTGFLAKVTGEIEIGEVLEVELPEGGFREVRAVWLNEGLAGFDFIEPISSAAISSAFLKSDFDIPGGNPSQIGKPVNIEALLQTLDIPWKDAALQPGPARPERLSLRTRTLIILGLAIGSWAAIIAAVMAIF